jgi:hypothetical protein
MTATVPRPQFDSGTNALPPIGVIVRVNWGSVSWNRFREKGMWEINVPTQVEFLENAPPRNWYDSQVFRVTCNVVVSSVLRIRQRPKPGSQGCNKHVFRSVSQGSCFALSVHRAEPYLGKVILGARNLRVGGAVGHSPYHARDPSLPFPS